MTQRTYYEDDSPVWEWWGNPAVALPEDRNRIEVRHGYTLDNLDHLTRRALIRCHGSGLEYTDRYMVAYEAVTIALMEADEAPEEADLVAAGQYAVSSASAAEYRHHGVTTSDGVGPRFGAYWLSVAGAAPSPEERIDERIALTQIWPHLTDMQRESLVMFAVTDQRAKAAEALGVREGTMASRIREARKAALALWHDHETPAPPPRDRRRGANKRPPVTHCKWGHEYTLDNTINRWSPARRQMVRKCRACRDAGNAARAAQRRASA